MPAQALNRWWTVVAGVMSCATGAGVVFIYAFGILSAGFTAEYGWGRSTYSYCQTAFMVASGIGTILLGNMIHRWGVRRPSIVLVALFALSVALVGALPSYPLAFYLVFAAIGLTGAAATAMPYAISVAAWFDSNRGLALGLVNSGAGVGAVLFPHYAAHLNTTRGWRVGFVGVGLVIGFVAISGLLFLVKDPPGNSAGIHSVPAHRSGRYVRTRIFWMIALPVLGISVATIGSLGSLVPMLADRRIHASQIALTLSAAGLSSWISRVVVGYALDKFFAPYVGAATFLIAALGIWLVGSGHSVIPMAVGAGLIGFALGAEGGLLPFLVSRYFHGDIYSKVLGAMWVMWAWGGGIGTGLVAITFELTRSYTSGLTAFGALLLISVVVIWALPPYTYPVAKPASRT